MQEDTAKRQKRMIGVAAPNTDASVLPFVNLRVALIPSTVTLESIILCTLQYS